MKRHYVIMIDTHQQQKKKRASSPSLHHHIQLSYIERKVIILSHYTADEYHRYPLDSTCEVRI